MDENTAEFGRMSSLAAVAPGRLALGGRLSFLPKVGGLNSLSRGTVIPGAMRPLGTMSGRPDKQMTIRQSVAPGFFNHGGN